VVFFSQESFVLTYVQKSASLGGFTGLLLHQPLAFLSGWAGVYTTWTCPLHSLKFLWEMQISLDIWLLHHHSSFSVPGSWLHLFMEWRSS